MKTLGVLNAIILIHSRIPYAMSRDAFLPPAVGRVNAGGTPGVSLVLGTCLALGFIISNAFDAVLSVLAFFMVATYALVLTAFFKLRRREPDAPRPFRVPAYPVVPGLALAGAVAFLVATTVGDPRNSASAIGLVALSWPVSVLVRRHLARSTVPHGRAPCGLGAACQLDTVGRARPRAVPSREGAQRNDHAPGSHSRKALLGTFRVEGAQNVHYELEADQAGERRCLPERGEGRHRPEHRRQHRQHRQQRRGGRARIASVRWREDAHHCSTCRPTTSPVP